MAKDSELPKAGDKGKGKAVEEKPADAPKDKDGKPLANGKKDDDKPECVLVLSPNSSKDGADRIV